MQTRLIFNEFSNALSNKTVPLAKLASYLELVPDSSVPKLQFTNDVLLDAPPSDFDMKKLRHPVR